MAEEESFLVPSDTYFKAGVHIGTKFRTKYMADYIYKIRGDGLSIMNVSQIDKKIREAVKFLIQYNPEDIIVVSRRENGWKPVTLFGRATGCRTIIKRYQPGRFTNSQLETFTEAKVLIVTDAWPDRNALKDGRFSGMKILGICDTNNETYELDYIIPGNNKGRQSLGLIYYLIAREFCKEKGLPFEIPEDEFVGEEEDIA